MDSEVPGHMEGTIPWLIFFLPGLHSQLLTTLDKGDKPTLLVNTMLYQYEVLAKEETNSEDFSYMMISESNISC